MDQFLCIFLRKNGLIFAILCKWKKEVLEMCLMWESKDRSRSKITPRFLTVVLEAKVMPSSVTRSLGKVLLRCLGPSTITSVLSEFSNRKLQVIEVFMSFYVLDRPEGYLTY